MGGHPFKDIGPIDGDKWVCFDEINPKDCTVLSFGINNEWSFEDDMDKSGCMVCINVLNVNIS